MSDISTAVNKAMEEIVNNGTVETIIKNKLEKTVESAIDDALRSYSDFGKALSEQISESLCVDVKKVSLEQHTDALLKMMEGAVNQHVHEAAQEKVKRQINELFEPPPQNITLQELINQYIEDNRDEAARDGHDCCALIIEESDYDFIYVGLNPSTKKGSRYSFSSSDEFVSNVSDCELQLHFNKEDKESDKLKISWISYGGYKRETTASFLPTIYHGFSRLLFQMYIAGTTINLEHGIYAENYETYYPEHRY